jgi:peptide/nickel transport system substrate-binding protein
MSPIQTYLPGVAGKSEIRNPKSEIHNGEGVGIPNSSFLTPNSAMRVYDAALTMRGHSRILLTVAVVVFASACAQSPPVKSLRMAYPHELVTMDPHAHADAVTGLVLSAVYENLVRFDPGQPVKPGLADRWTTPDETTWRIHVRDGVRFHDGSRLTPEDVVSSIERARASGVLGHQLDDIERVELLEGDGRTIEIKTDRPAPLLLTRFESVAIVPRGFNPANPVGTGPYRWRVGSVQGPVVLERWDDYWARAPDFDEVTIQFVSVHEELAELLHNQKLDVVASVTVSYVEDHERGLPWRVVALPTVATTYLGMNVSLPPLDDPRVREAIDDVIDRSKLVADVYPPGFATPATSLVSPEVFGFSPAHRRQSGGLDRAKRLLAEAGVTPGTRLKLDHQERYVSVIGPLVDLLAEVGIEIEPQLHQYESFYRRMEAAENELFLFSWNFTIADASPFLDAIVHSRDPLRGLGSFNAAAVGDPELDRLIEEAAHETRSEARLELLQFVLAEVGAVHAYIPLFQPASLSLVREPFEIVGRQVRPQGVRLKN